MKKLILLLGVFLIVGCNRSSMEVEKCPLTGLPPASLQIFVNKENLHAQDFLNDKDEKDEAVYFYKLAEDNTTQIRYETNLFFPQNNNGFYISFPEWEQAIVGRNIEAKKTETIYLNNKGKTDVIQVRIVYVKQRCDSYYLCEELIINGEKRKAGFSLSNSLAINLIE